MTATADTARDKLTIRELAALRAQLRRELVVELAERPARPPRVREVPELAACARRMIRAVGKRCGQQDVEGLAELVTLRADVEAALVDGVTLARAQGFSWAFVGDVLGMTRQSAQQRFGA